MKYIKNFELCIRRVKLEFPFEHKFLTPQDVCIVARELIGIVAHEHMIVFFLNTQNQIIGYSKVGIGGVSYCPVDVRVIFRNALILGAQGIILAHNHPSGNLMPSEDDFRLTQKVAGINELLGISLIDHLVITMDEYFSIREHYPQYFEGK